MLKVAIFIVGLSATAGLTIGTKYTMARRDKVFLRPKDVGFVANVAAAHGAKRPERRQQRRDPEL
jgi:hypothetical protein